MGRRRELLPCLAMVIVQVGYAGMNITSKVAMDSGMNPFILVSYRQIFATLAVLPAAYFFERASLNQILYFVGLKNTTATISCALSNMVPAITFLLAVPFGLEAVGLKSRGGQAKIIGTIVCVGGAMLLSFYHGHVIDIPQPKIHWQFGGDHNTNNSPTKSATLSHQSFFLGPFLLIASNLAMAIWFILQAKLSEQFAAPYTSSALMCSMASIQCIVVALCSDHKISDWSLNSRIRSVASVYAGLVGSALAFCLMSWTIQRKGPLYASVFSPLLLVIVAFLSWVLNMEKLYVGTVIGSVLIVGGLYAVLWGKKKEITKDSNTVAGIISIANETDDQGQKDNQEDREDLEKQLQLVNLDLK
ncbi:hypothetical protein Cgig2_030170 [Carnegiea gigantea]|uniref:WAT1-related protein n=1 Tax=Carnegiea gigantea TaxID=171969 RepID=A0A9Q1K999_9CARY|nr:hypothetical protein Cgig2_030170 [Carnegiea gigantea]